MEDFKNVLASVRRLRRMTQRDLADASGVSLNTIARYETGEVAPRADSVLKLAEALDCSVDVLLGRVPLVTQAR